MAKSLCLVLIVVIAMIAAGLYGALHDQLTYTLSQEYYTKFKFIQFELVDEGPVAKLDNPRMGAALVGFLATIAVGFWVGLILGVLGLFHSTWKKMLFITLRAMVLNLLIAFIVGIIGLAYGWFIIGKRDPAILSNWYLPDNLTDFRSFVAVGSMHNFSYLGGAIGLIVSAVYSLWMLLANRKRMKISAAGNIGLPQPGPKME